MSPGESHVPAAAEPPRLRTGPLYPARGWGTNPWTAAPRVPASLRPSAGRGEPGMSVCPSVRPSARPPELPPPPPPCRVSRAPPAAAAGSRAPLAGLRPPRGGHGPPPLPAGAGGATVAVGAAVGAAPAAGPPRAAPPGRRQPGSGGDAQPAPLPPGAPRLQLPEGPQSLRLPASAACAIRGRITANLRLNRQIIQGDAVLPTGGTQRVCRLRLASGFRELPVLPGCWQGLCPIGTYTEPVQGPAAPSAESSHTLTQKAKVVFDAGILSTWAAKVD